MRTPRRTYRLIADFPWPDWHGMPKPDVIPGQVRYGYDGATYGCTAWDEIAVTLAPGVLPAYGIPESALERWPTRDEALERVDASARRAALRMISTDEEV